MDLYFFHLHECGTILEDLEGRECASLEHAVDTAIASARDVMSGEVRDGQLCMSCYISISSTASVEVGRVYFRDAVILTGL